MILFLAFDGLFVTDSWTNLNPTIKLKWIFQPTVESFSNFNCCHGITFGTHMFFQESQAFWKLFLSVWWDFAWAISKILVKIWMVIDFAWWEQYQTSHRLILPGFKVDQKKRVVLFKKKKRCVMQTRSSNDVLFVTYRSPQKHC